MLAGSPTFAIERSQLSMAIGTSESATVEVPPLFAAALETNERPAALREHMFLPKIVPGGQDLR